MGRQKLIGWILVVVAAFYLAWFLKERLFTAGPRDRHKEWVQLVGSIVMLMLGTTNVRLAAMRARSHTSISDDSLEEPKMTTRIDRRFAELKTEGRAALVTFLMAGDPGR